jgi:hypothetical protein
MLSDETPEGILGMRRELLGCLSSAIEGIEVTYHLQRALALALEIDLLVGHPSIYDVHRATITRHYLNSIWVLRESRATPEDV